MTKYLIQVLLTDICDYDDSSCVYENVIINNLDDCLLLASFYRLFTNHSIQVNNIKTEQQLNNKINQFIEENPTFIDTYKRNIDVSIEDNDEYTLIDFDQIFYRMNIGRTSDSAYEDIYKIIKVVVIEITAVYKSQERLSCEVI